MLRTLLVLAALTSTTRSCMVPFDTISSNASEQYTCYDTNFLCPVIDRQPALRCGEDCYMPNLYSCADDQLITPQISNLTSASSDTCDNETTVLHLSGPPYENHFYSDCHAASQVIITSPEPDSNLTIISPRVIVAWPAGNSGIVTYFAPENGINGTLGIQLLNSSSSIAPLSPIYEAPTIGSNATVGISTQLRFNSSAVLEVVILGSVRTIRDFTEGPSLLHEEIQDAIKYEVISNGVKLSRPWLDNITTTSVSFTSPENDIKFDGKTVNFQAGNYTFNASFNYPQLTQLSSKQVLTPESFDLIVESKEQTESLSFLSYTTKLTAGAWRFLTYFGRDSMISALLLQPVLSEGEGGALESVIAAVLERINSTDGTVCHEETIGDYATWLNLQDNITSIAPLCDYKMIDSDYFLPVLMDRYFLQSDTGSSRVSDFLATRASFFPSNTNLTYLDLAKLNAEKIITTSAPFAAPGNQTIDNLIRLKEDEPVGQWRDSTYGIGGGRIPFDVNAALVPAGLRSIAALSAAGIFPYDTDMLNDYAQTWEDSTLPFFEISLPEPEAQKRVSSFASVAPTYNYQVSGLPSQSSSIDSNLTFYAIALEGDDNLAQVEVMHTDDSFRHFFLNTTNQPQLTSFLNATANNVKRRFPAGLMTDVGMVVANPAFGSQPVYAENFTTSAYHGTVVWSWQLAIMAKGLELQLARYSSSSQPGFCYDSTVYQNVKEAYNILWDSIEKNESHLSTEVWSWVYDSEADEMVYVDLGALPPPPGESPTESDIVQLWSLTFLAVKRNEGLR